MIVSNIHNVVMKKGEDDREKKPEKSVKQKISLANPCITAEKFFFDNKTD